MYRSSYTSSDREASGQLQSGGNAAMIRRVLAVNAVAMTAFAAPVFAEDPERSAATSPPVDEAPTPRPEATEEIVVTGSRVRRKDLTTPAPVIVITREQITRSGYVSVGEFLQALPEQANGMNRQWNNGGDGSTRVNLRCLGAHRTLVLLNGRRVVAGGNGANMSADVGAIPMAVVERIEVLKDGASPMYGSDALGGVVNVITRRGWSGAEASALSGISSRGDGATYDASVTAGRSGEDGSLLFSAGYAKQQTVWSGDREFGRWVWALDLTGFNSPLGIPGPYAIGSGNTPEGTIQIPGPPGVTLPNPEGDPRRNLYNQLVTTYPNATRFVRDASEPLGWRPWRAG